MRVIPAIDVLDGRVVRLCQGDFGQVSAYGEDPLALAAAYEGQGATRLHLVDLSGARDGKTNARFLRLLGTLRRRTRLAIQAGGGVRSLAGVQRLLDAGASRVVLGSMVVTAPETMATAVALFGRERLIAALDVREGEIRIHGWQHRSGTTLAAALAFVQDIGIREVLITDIERDGTGTGPHVDLYAPLHRGYPRLSLIASGGVRDAHDLTALERAGCAAVVVGKALLDGGLTLRSSEETTLLPWPQSSERAELAVRVIPCLDLAGGRVVKGTRFDQLRDAGDPVELARDYCRQGADELVFLDITATAERRRPLSELVAAVAEVVNIPFTVGGGVRCIEDAHRLLGAGADKVAVNSAAVSDPALLERMAGEIGRANIVCAIDARRKGDGWTVLTRGGRDDAGRDAVRWAAEAVRHGAGELLVTSHDRDGTGEGFDVDLLAAIRDGVAAPVIAAGGGGSLASFVDAVRRGGAAAVLAASVFHFGILSIADVKKALREASCAVRA